MEKCEIWVNDKFIGLGHAFNPVIATKSNSEDKYKSLDKTVDTSINITDEVSSYFDNGGT